MDNETEVCANCAGPVVDGACPACAMKEEAPMAEATGEEAPMADMPEEEATA